MQIRDIFSKNLFRPINGVVKADQKDEAVVWQELDEYVITKELDQHFRKFFAAFLYAIQNAHDPNIIGRIGIWVSGFFGSGKSHFIKILSYLLGNLVAQNPDTGDEKEAVRFFEHKIQDPMLLADIKKATSTNTDVILFNIDSRADSREGRGAILSVFWRVFNEMQGFSGDAPHIAEMERQLSKKGRFQEFCTAFKEVSGEDWLSQRDAYLFHKDDLVYALSQALGQSQESAAEWFEKAEQSMSLTIENFAKRVNEYLDARGKDHRLIFLVDEVGQFIGDDEHLMLNLQTITEDLGRICKGRAWVVVTSQEDIDSILGDLKSSRANDFSKIQGRFTTRLSLSSSNTDEVIQARLLDKTPEAKTELANLFASKGDILINQLTFSNDSASLKSFQDRQDFINNYPFAPFHFQLVQKVFEAIRTAGATGLHLSRGERSMLDAFQSAAKNISDREIGALVPLYAFYPAIESFLDTAVKRTIDQANENPALKHPFDDHLLQTLFLIRYVDIIKPNVDNLVTLFIDEVDADRLALKREIEAGLERLEKQTLISRNGDLYFFLTNEERDVSREIKGVEITSAEEVKLLAEIVYSDILKDHKQYRYKPYKRDYPFSRLLDGHPYSSRLDQEIAVEVITPLADDYDAFNELKRVMHTSENYGRVLIQLPENDELEREVRICLQTDKYIRQKSDASQSTSFSRILRDRQEENRERRSRLRNLLEKLLVDAHFSALGQTLDIKGSTPRAVVEEGIEYVIVNLYNKFHYLSKLHEAPDKEIRAVLMATDLGQLELQKGLTEVNKEARQEVKEYIRLMVHKNHQVLLSDLIEHFAKRPYGWPEWEVVLLVAKIYMAGELNLLMNGTSLSAREALEPMLKTAKWRTVKILQRKVPSAQDVEKAQKLCQELFGKIGPEGFDDLDKAIRTQLTGWQKSLQQYQQLAQTGEYPGQKEIEDGLAVIQAILAVKDTYEFIKTFHSKRDDLLDTCEDLHTLHDFYTNQRPTWDKLKKSLAEFSKNEAALTKDGDAASALNHLHRIAEAEAPYGMLKDVNPLVSKLSEINEQMVDQKREEALGFMAARKNAVDQELQQIQAGQEFAEQVTKPLEDIRNRVKNETSIPNISYLLEEFERAIYDAFDRIEETKQPPDQEEKSNPKPAKKTKTIKTSSLSTKAYLENEQDVENFVQNLKQKLLEELGHDVRIRIE
ncbi:BREX system P-loop protein BrxC [Desulfovermiculus halophilus]|uniref:BREX system P-loop protein BrxC n=1 Tax=Desulfovermiculus halophilus TaxID=339722 RepID=UPI00047FBC70|nr:BREX system P-loop protein BrxC [Desulfovermiculus halophilus]